MKERLIATGDFTASELECATPHELFELWCNYEGLVHYADKILEALRDCGYEVKVSEPNNGNRKPAPDYNPTKALEYLGW